MRFEETAAKPPSRQGSKASTVVNNESYDYEAEERFIRGEGSISSAANRSAQQKKKNQTSTSARLSVDNKAYKPSSSEEEQSEDEWSDDNSGRRRKKGKKKDEGRSLVLPTIGYDKRRKKRKGERGPEEEESISFEEQAPSQAQERRSVSKPPSRAGSVPRETVPPSHPAHYLPVTEEVPETEDEELLESGHDTSHDQVEIPQLSPPPVPRAGSKAPQSKSEQRAASKERRRSRSTSKTADDIAKALSQMEAQHRSSPAPRGVGAALGTIVHSVLRRGVQLVALVFFLFWTVISGIIHLCFLKPFGWLPGNASRDMPMKNLTKVVVVAIIVAITGFALHPSSGFAFEFASSVGDYFWHLIPERRGPIYHAPSLPVENVEDLINRLTQIEAALADLASSSTSKAQRMQRETQQALDRVHDRLEAEIQRARDTEKQLGIAAAQGLSGIRSELATINTEQERVRSAANIEDFRELQDRVVNVESNVKEALEVAKKTETQSAAKWDSKSIKGITIKTDKGQDVTAMIGTMVDDAFSLIYKDGIGKPDFALYSAGGRVMTSLTTPTYEIKPDSWGRYLFGAVTGSGYAMGQPPVRVLHPDIGIGNCWPFAGTYGQIGIRLARRVFISEVSVEHAPNAIAFDVSSAPRHVEVWGLVEGKDNVVKIDAYQRIVQERREEVVKRAKAEGTELPPDDDAYPASIPRSPHYIRLAQFEYDVEAPKHVQTFKVPQEIQDIGVDFGIVIFLIKDNWGEEQYTCLYRVRVHGTEMDRQPLSLPDQDSL
ncbi:hypothetical protein M422DRAFT_43394 [Sphaerobolus stellatus SS14]|nr:hypothetical protein M422DRAFT_43394 [Sphaerobolus stellatus SS14]